MSSPQDRFRIPGGSLDLDFDDEHEHTALAVDTSPPSAESSQAQVQMQSIAHLTPFGLSCILSWICHPLAYQTAEYARAMNLSGKAFLTFERSALHVLANRDALMTEELVRIQQGVFPCAPSSAAPSEAHHPGDDKIATSPHTGEQNTGGPSSFPGVDLSSVPPAFPPAQLPLAQVPSDPSESSSSPPPPPSPHTDPPAAVTALSSSDGGVENQPPPALEGTSSCLQGGADASTGYSGSHSEGNSHASGSVPAPPSASSTTGGVHGRESELDVLQDVAGVDHTPSHSGNISLDNQPQLSGSTVDLRLQTSDTHVLSHVGDTSLDNQSQLSESTVGPPLQTPFTSTQPSTTDGGDHLVDTPDAVEHPSVRSDSRTPPAAAADEESSVTKPHAASSPAPSDDSASVPPIPTAPKTYAPDQSSSTTVQVGAGEHTSSPLVPRVELPTSLSPSTKETINTPERSSPDPMAGRAFDDLPISYVPVGRELETPDSTSSTSASHSLLDTPSDACRFRPDHDVDTDSFLAFDLLDFSPFSIGAQLHHDQNFSSPGEPSKAGAYSIGTCTRDIPDFYPNLMVGGAWDGHADSEIERLSERSSGDLREPDIKNQTVTAHDGAAHPSSTCTTGSRAAAAVAEGITLPLHENSRDVNRSQANNGDRSGTYIKEDGYGNSSVTEVGYTQRNLGLGSRTGVHHSTRSTSDSPRSHAEIDQKNVEPRPCDSKKPAHSDLPGYTARPCGSSAKCCMADLDQVSPTPSAQVPSCPDVALSRSSSAQEHHLSGTTVSDMPIDSEVVRKTELRPSFLGLAIPISPTSLTEELSQLSPLFSPTDRETRSSAFERQFSKPHTPITMTPGDSPVKLRYGTRKRRAVRQSKGTSTSDLDLHEESLRPAQRVSIDASVQTDCDVEEEQLRRRLKFLERELRSLRAAARRPEERAQPKSVWGRMLTTDRNLGLSKNFSFSSSPSSSNRTS
ncbi:hypothetical protein B0H10DRAFT_2039322 [Mycena sp. CBHHK59/15]|nr:hypothetical protein B0H10DRAFT_2039322 [Mycena sp. CBHHK59/15]